MIEAVEYNDLDALRPYEDAWLEMLRQTPRASFFLTTDWLRAYAGWRSDRERLRVILVRQDGGRLVGVLPMTERTERTSLGPLRVLTYPLDEWGMWYGPIGPNPSATLAMAMQHLAREPRTWDVLAPCWVPHDSTDGGRTEHAMRMADLNPQVETHATTSVLHFNEHESWDAYLAWLPAKVRQEIRRKRRKFESDHTSVEYLRWRPESTERGPGEPAWPLFEECLAISQNSWQAKSPNGNTLCNREVASLLRDAHCRAARLGMIDLNLLRVGGRPAAYYYGYRYGGDLFGLRTGFDPGVADGAGAVLLGRLIEDSFRRGDTRLDLGVGPESYKRRLRTATESCSRLTYNAPNVWRARLLATARQWKRRWSGAA